MSSKHTTSASHSIQSHLKRAMASGNWFLFRRDYVVSGLMTKTQALFFQNLINVSAMTGVREDADGFFQCSFRYLYESLRWNPTSQKNTMKWLEKKRYLETRLVKAKDSGRDNDERWVRVDISKVEDDLDKLLQKRNGVPLQKRNGVPLQKRNEKENTLYSQTNTNTVAAGAADGVIAKSVGFEGIKPPVKKDWASKLAQYTYQELAAHRLIDSKSTTKGFAIKFRDHVQFIINRDSFTKSEAEEYIQSVIEDHLSHLKAEFQPQCHCAKTMCERFSKLERAFHKRQSKTNYESEVDNYAF